MFILGLHLFLKYFLYLKSTDTAWINWKTIFQVPVQ